MKQVLISIIICAGMLVGTYQCIVLPNVRKDSYNSGFIDAKLEEVKPIKNDTFFIVRVKKVWFKTVNYVKLSPAEMKVYKEGDIIDIDGNTHFPCSDCPNTIQVVIEGCEIK